MILHGELRIGSETHENLIVLPCEVVADDVELTLFLSHDYRKLVIAGSGLAVSLYGKAEYVKEFSAVKDPQ